MVILAPVRFLILSEINETVLLVKEMLVKCGWEMYWRNNPHTCWTITAIVLFEHLKNFKCLQRDSKLWTLCCHQLSYEATQIWCIIIYYYRYLAWQYPKPESHFSFEPQTKICFFLWTTDNLIFLVLWLVGSLIVIRTTDEVSTFESTSYCSKFWVFFPTFRFQQNGWFFAVTNLNKRPVFLVHSNN